MIDSRSNRFAQALFHDLPARYDPLAELLSFGQNKRWRRELVEHLAGTSPQRVLDAAAGTAGVAIALAQQTPARVVSLDVSEAMLRRGLLNVERSRLQNRVQLVAGAAEELPFPPATFDAISFTYLLRYVADPAATLRELARVLKPGGWMASLEFYVPIAPLWRACWRAYTRWLLPFGGWVSGGASWRKVGQFLGSSIEEHYRRYPLDWTVRAWQMAGMNGVRTQIMSLGGGLVMWGQKAAG